MIKNFLENYFTLLKNLPENNKKLEIYKEFINQFYYSNHDYQKIYNSKQKIIAEMTWTNLFQIMKYFIEFKENTKIQISFNCLLANFDYFNSQIIKNIKMKEDQILFIENKFLQFIELDNQKEDKN